MNWTAWTREQRLSVITLALCLGAIPLTGLNGWLIYVLAYGWHGFDAERLKLLGSAGMQNSGLLLVVEIALAMVLSVRAFKASFGKDGASLNMQSNGNDDAGSKMIAAGDALSDAGASIKGETP